MQILKGTKREITLMEWGEVLAKAEKRLADSQKCLDLFGEESDRMHVEEDEQKVAEIKHQIEEVIEFMDKHNIR